MGDKEILRTAGLTNINSELIKHREKAKYNTFQNYIQNGLLSPSEVFRNLFTNEEKIQEELWGK